jgi:transglutaminase-like putative cysteine protease
VEGSKTDVFQSYLSISVLAALKRFFGKFILIAACIMCTVETYKQIEENKYLKRLADEIIRQNNACDNISRVIALRDYLRRNVTHQFATHDDRPFLRASAAETLRSGKGYCGESTRAFIKLADAVGIRAQRINLYGESSHVLAEAELRPGYRLLVDSQNPPQVRDLESLDRVIVRPEYRDYSTLNLRRLRLNGLITRVKLEIGPLTYWTENPHALKAAMWAGLASIIVFTRIFWMVSRTLAVRSLQRNGWVRATRSKSGQFKSG